MRSLLELDVANEAGSRKGAKCMHSESHAPTILLEGPGRAQIDILCICLQIIHWMDGWMASDRDNYSSCLRVRTLL